VAPTTAAALLPLLPLKAAAALAAPAWAIVMFERRWQLCQQ
jgi:hypothetical protein